MNQIINDFDLTDLLKLHKKEIMLDLNCHHLGTVQSFDAAKQTCQITIDYKKTYYEKDASGSLKTILKNYSALVDCPVLILGGTGGTIRFPIKQGDKALVLFNDRDIDNWFKGSTESSPNSNRLHSLSDGIALIGLHPLDRSMSDYDPDAAGIHSASAKVVAKEKVKIENNSGTLNAALAELGDAIKNLITVPIPGQAGLPSGAAMNPASKMAVDQALAKIGELLE